MRNAIAGFLASSVVVLATAFSSSAEPCASAGGAVPASAGGAVTSSPATRAPGWPGGYGRGKHDDRRCKKTGYCVTHAAPPLICLVDCCIRTTGYSALNCDPCGTAPDRAGATGSIRSA